jgi:hypothetical protein
VVARPSASSSPTATRQVVTGGLGRWRPTGVGVCYDPLLPAARAPACVVLFFTRAAAALPDRPRARRHADAVVPNGGGHRAATSRRLGTTATAMYHGGSGENPSPSRPSDLMVVLFPRDCWGA